MEEDQDPRRRRPHEDADEEEDEDDNQHPVLTNADLMQFLLRAQLFGRGGPSNTNTEMVRSLKQSGVLKSAAVENAFTMVPRGEFVTEDMRPVAYEDTPQRFATMGFNISAPHMYAVCLEKLELAEGQSFLDIGSGCGHLTVLGGFLVGKTGIAHGLDIRQDIVDFAENNLKKFVQKSGLDLSNVKFFLRNCFVPDVSEMLYDRIHVGACCPEYRLEPLFALLAPGGILVTPYGDKLIRARKSETGEVKIETLLSVRYGDLVIPSDAEIRAAKLAIEKKKAMQVVVPSSVFVLDMCSMVDNKQLHDLIIDVNGKKICAHKFILKLRSTYFKHLLESHTGGELGICLPSIDHKHLLEVLKFIYSGDTSFITTHNVMEYHTISKELDLKGLQAACEAIVQKAPLPPNTIFLEFGNLLSTGEQSDLTISVDEKQVCVHKFIVGARSKHFMALLSSGLKESRNNQIHLQDFKYYTLLDVLKFLYTEDTSIITGENVVDILEAANFLDLDHLKAICESMLHKNLDIENVPYLIQVAHRFEAPQLMRVCFEYLFDHYEEVCASKQFLELDKETLVMITTEACKRLSKMTQELTKI